MTQQRVVLTLPGMDRVPVRRGLTYRTTDTSRLGMDVYYPSGPAAGPRPAVVFVTGYPDPGAEQMLGRKLKDWNVYIGWAQLVASMGLAGITYENEEPTEDASRVLRHIHDNAESLGIDRARIGIWSASGNVPNALAQIARGHAVRCAAYLYGYTMDLDGGTAVADAAARWRFVDGMSDQPFERIPPIPQMLVRAGRDELPGLNDSMDRFAQRAVAAGLPVTIVNHADAPHGFDTLHDTESSRTIMRQVLAYLRMHLLG